MTKLLRSNFEYKRKMINVTLGIRSAFGTSNLQADYRRAHPTNDVSYSIELIGSTYLVSNTTESPAGEVVRTLYRLRKNAIRCNSEICEVKCLDCPNAPVCAHSYICDCPHYGQRNFCRHCHLVAMSQFVQPPNLDHQYVMTRSGHPGWDQPLCHEGAGKC